MKANLIRDLIVYVIWAFIFLFICKIEILAKHWWVLVVIGLFLLGTMDVLSEHWMRRWRKR